MYCCQPVYKAREILKIVDDMHASETGYKKVIKNRTMKDYAVLFHFRFVVMEKAFDSQTRKITNFEK